MSTTIQAGFEAIRDRLQCPRCGGRLNLGAEAVTCGGCREVFPVRGGIPLLAIHGTTETWSGGPAPGTTETSAAYQREYEELEEARKYNEAYRDKPTKQWSTSREYRLLERLLGSQPRSGVLLDLPSGGGRLSDQLGRYTDLLVEADIAVGQLLYALEHHEGGDERLWMTASAFHIPFRDESVDGVVCCRLNHHLPTPEERARLVTELLRVARRFVIMTFFDHHSVKNYLRRMRSPFNRKPPKMTMRVDEVRRLAREHGAELVTAPPLSRLFSGHRYGLMVKS
jgi:SAM-dependent methyltransferase